MITIHDGANIDFIEISKIPINFKALKHFDISPMKIWINFILRGKGKKYLIWLLEKKH